MKGLTMVGGCRIRTALISAENPIRLVQPITSRYQDETQDGQSHCENQIERV